MAQRHKKNSARQPLPVLLEPDEIELRTWVQMVRAFTRIERRLEQMTEEHGLTLPQFDVLMTLSRDEGITQQELAQRLLVTKGNICGMIDRMGTAGWVERRPDSEDRRANRLFLTRRGKALLADTTPDQIDEVRRIMGVLTPEELQTFFHFLDRLEEGTEN